MQIFPVLAVATAIFASSAAAECFQSGEHWGNHDTADSSLRDACNSLKGSIDGGKTNSQCREGNGHAFQFSIKNEESVQLTASYDDCVNIIGQIISDCGHGGQTESNGLTFRGDPNAGGCLG